MTQKPVLLVGVRAHEQRASLNIRMESRATLPRTRPGPSAPRNPSRTPRVRSRTYTITRNLESPEGENSQPPSLDPNPPDGTTSSAEIAYLCPLRLCPGASVRGVKEPRDSHPPATAAQPGLVLTGRQVAERWQGSSHCIPARTRLRLPRRQAAERWLSFYQRASARAGPD